MVGAIDNWPRDKFAIDLNKVGWSAPGAFLQGLTAIPFYLQVSSLSTDQNNFSPEGFNTHPYVSLESSVDIDITGMVPAQQGELKFIVNRGSNNITLVRESVLSDPPNRFAGAQDLVLTPNEGMFLIQDPDADRWRFISNGVPSATGRIPYPTLADALNSVPIGATFFFTGAYAETGDGGQGIYTAIDTPVSPAAGQYEAATGEWFELASLIINPEQFGADKTSTALTTNITGISRAAAAQVTIANHGISDGTIIYINEADNMSQINDRFFVVANSSTNTFTLKDFLGADIDSSAYGTYVANSASLGVTINSTTALVECRECAQRLNRPQFWGGHYLLDPGAWVWEGDVSTGHKPGPVIQTGADVRIYPTNVSMEAILDVRKSDVGNVSFVMGGYIGDMEFRDTNTYTDVVANITGISNGDPAVLTSVGHPFSEDDRIYINNVVGMPVVNGTFYKVVDSGSPDNFFLYDTNNDPINAGGYGTYVSGGTATLTPMRRAINLSGVQGITFGKMIGTTLKGDLFFIENRTVGINSDFYHVSLATFNGGAVTQGLSSIFRSNVPVYCISNDLRGQGFSSSMFGPFAGLQCAAWRQPGAAISGLNVMTGSYGPGWALDFNPGETVFRGYMDSAEFDAPEYGMRVNDIEGLFIRAVRIVIRAGGTTAYPFIPAGQTWPRNCFSIGSPVTLPSPTTNTRNCVLGVAYRVEVPLNMLPPLLDFNNDPVITNIQVDVGINPAAPAVVITSALNSTVSPGRYRLVMATTEKLSTGMVLQVNGVATATSLNGQWYTIVVNSATEVDLLASVYVNDGTGGTLGVASLNISDAIPSAMTISGMANNGSGRIRVTANDTTDLIDGQSIRIINATGMVEANGVWTVIKVSGSTTDFDLQGSAAINAYTGNALVRHPWFINIHPSAVIRITRSGKVVWDSNIVSEASAAGFSMQIVGARAAVGGDAPIPLGTSIINVGANSTLATGAFAKVEGVRGVTGVNGDFNITLVGSTEVALDGSTFGGAYTTPNSGRLWTAINNTGYSAIASKVWYTDQRADSSGFYFPSIASMQQPFTGVLTAQARFMIPAYFGMRVRMAVMRTRANTTAILGESFQYGVGDGTADRTITGITNANPAVVTCSATHNIANGSLIYISGVSGMTEVNGKFWITSAAAGADFTLQSIAGVNFDASALSAGTGGIVKMAPAQTFSVVYEGSANSQFGDLIWISADQNSASVAAVLSVTGSTTNAIPTTRFEMGMITQ